jgi:hypothetical protein
MKSKDIFEIIIDEIRNSSEIGNFYSAVVLVLTIPGICASIDSDKGHTLGRDKKLYTKWLDKYTVFKHKKKYLNSTNVYYLRCKILHNGRLLKNKIDKNGFDIQLKYPSNAVISSTDGSGVPLILIGDNERTIVWINIDEFIKNITDGIVKWRENVIATDNYKKYIKDTIKLGIPNVDGIYTNIQSFH